MEERREHPREWWPFTGKYRPAGGDAWQTTNTPINISTGGLRFKCGDRFTEDAALEFELVLSAKQGPRLFRGRVIWSRPVSRSSVEYGVEFLDVEPDDRAALSQLVLFLGAQEPLDLQSDHDR